MNTRRLARVTGRVGLAFAAAGMIAAAAPAYAAPSSVTVPASPSTTTDGCSSGGAGTDPATPHDPARNADDGCIGKGTGVDGPGYNGEDPRS